MAAWNRTPLLTCLRGHRMHLTLPLLSALFIAPLTPVAPAGKPGLTRPAAPQVRSQGYRFVVERFIQQDNVTREFVEDKPGTNSGRQHFYLGLAIYPPDPKLAANIQGLDPKILGFAGTNVINFRSYPADDTGPAASGVWRTQLAAQELDLGINRITKVQGELVVFPRARKVTLDFPLPITTQLSKSAEGFKATVKNVRPRTGGLSMTVDMEWPSEMSLAFLNSDTPGGVTALTQAGTPLIPNGAGSSGTERGGRVLRVHNLVLSDLKDQPAKIRVEVLVRSGVPLRIPFTLPEIAVPDTLGLESQVVESDEPDRRDHPFYAPDGGTLAATVRRKPNLAEGKLLMGISRQEGPVAGPTRWLELSPDSRGRAALNNVRAGRYRISLAWLPDGIGTGALAADGLPQTARLVGDPATVEVTPGKTAVLPPIDVGGSR